jgi:hypothetical protein
MTTQQPPAIYASPAPSQPIALENELLALTFIDAAETQIILAHGGWENDPVMKPFTRSPWTHFAAYAALNAGIRLIPPSKAKLWGLRVFVGVEAWTVGANARLLVNIR